MDYFNFDLKLSGGVGTRDFYVEVIGAPQAMRRDPVVAALPEEVLARWRESRGGERVNEELGRVLHAALFPPTVMEVWHASRELLGARRGLRLRLDIRSPRLAAVPWELMHDGRWHMALVRSTPVVRHPYGHPPVPPTTNVGPLNVLVLTSTPRDVPPLPEAAREAEAVTHILSGLKAEGRVGRVDLLPHVTKEKLRRRLQEHRYDVLHFIGHGEFESEEGYLVFEDEGGHCELMEAEALAYRFRESALRLLFLNACKSGVASRRGALLGVAQAALTAGVPAAVAMQAEIGDAAAAAFARGFYEQLAAGEPLELCMVEGRLGVFEGAGPRRADWAVPVLFSNVEEGLLWQLPKANAEREVEAARADGRRERVTYQQDVEVNGTGNIVGQIINMGAGRKTDD